MLENFLPETGIYVQLLRFLVVLVAGVVFTRLILMPAARRAASRKGADKVSMHSFENIAGLAGLFLSFIVALQGAQLGNLVTVLGAITAALTVAVGFGMREQIGNVVAGFFIFTDHPFVKGDFISSKEFEGVVTEIKLRHTVINGSSSEKVVLPNAMLTTQPLRNFTKGRRTKVDKEFKIPVKKAEKFEEICKKQASSHERVIDNPEPETVVKGLEDDKAIIGLNYWIKDSENVKEIRSNVTRNILDEAVSKKIVAEEKKEDEK
ncbi:mechanosensitive ion channel family protein [Candidatus Nanosalina sp. VS9-1]|uniref:mechanosensitive ion channel family protein n=1 Tax=Candidatus Nanosalina sp. VS9-1 TaxID=3388566 RepID=UPI0039E125C6